MKKTCDEPRIALFPGSFDPFTIGHESIVSRGLKIFDEIVVAVVENSDKKEFMDFSTRVNFIKSIFAQEPRVKVISFNGLTTDVAKQYNAGCLLRGVRMVQDFEYEKNLSEVYRGLSGIETVLLYTLPELGHISSTVVREMIRYNQDVTPYLPKSCDLSLLKEAKKKI